MTAEAMGGCTGRALGAHCGASWCIFTCSYCRTPPSSLLLKPTPKTPLLLNPIPTPTPTPTQPQPPNNDDRCGRVLPHRRRGGAGGARRDAHHRQVGRTMRCAVCCGFASRYVCALCCAFMCCKLCLCVALCFALCCPVLCFALRFMLCCELRSCCAAPTLCRTKEHEALHPTASPPRNSTPQPLHLQEEEHLQAVAGGVRSCREAGERLQGGADGGAGAARLGRPGSWLGWGTWGFWLCCAFVSFGGLGVEVLVII